MKAVAVLVCLGVGVSVPPYLHPFPSDFLASSRAGSAWGHFLLACRKPGTFKCVRESDSPDPVTTPGLTLDGHGRLSGTWRSLG